MPSELQVRKCQKYVNIEIRLLINLNNFKVILYSHWTSPKRETYLLLWK